MIRPIDEDGAEKDVSRSIIRIAVANTRRTSITRAEAIQRIFEYIEVWYNRKRIHASIGYHTPDEWEQRYFSNAS